MRKLHVIYVPGLGDNRYYIQSIAVKFWAFYGLPGHCHAMPWAGAGSYVNKEARLLAHIDELHAKGHLVSLVGASAGASAVLNAYAKRSDQVAAVVIISGKLHHPATVGRRTFAKNPAFKESLITLQANLADFGNADTAKMLSLYPTVDLTVAHQDAVIAGVYEQRLAVAGHARGIAVAISLQFYLIARFLKSQARLIKN